MKLLGISLMKIRIFILLILLTACVLIAFNAAKL